MPASEGQILRPKLLKEVGSILSAAYDAHPALFLFYTTNENIIGIPFAQAIPDLFCLSF